MDTVQFDGQVLFCTSNPLRGFLFILRLTYPQVTLIPFLPLPHPSVRSFLCGWRCACPVPPPPPLPPPHNKAHRSASITSICPDQHPVAR